MTTRRLALFGAMVLGFATVLAVRTAHSQRPEQRVVRIAEIEVDPQQVDAYKAALRAGIGAAIRPEPGRIAAQRLTLSGAAAIVGSQPWAMEFAPTPAFPRRADNSYENS